jgi:transcriptional regulator with XRE-family HTH domain
MNFSDRLKTVISRSGLKRDEFAKSGGISRAQLFKYLKGDQSPGTAFYQRLKANIPWINLEWLISGEGEPDLREIEGPPKTPPPPVDLELLESVIAGVEGVLGMANKELDPDKKAQVIILLYEYFHKSGEEADSNIVSKYVKLAV